MLHRYVSTEAEEQTDVTPKVTVGRPTTQRLRRGDVNLYWKILFWCLHGAASFYPLMLVNSFKDIYQNIHLGLEKLQKSLN